MSYFTRLLAAVVGAQPRPNPDDERLWSARDGAADFARSGVYVTPEAIQDLDAVAACLLALAGPISTLPIGVFEQADADGDEEDSAEAPEPGEASEADAVESRYKVLVPDHPIARLFNRRPNSRQTAQEFKDELIRHLAIYRNAYAEISFDRETGAVAALEIIHPDRVSKVERNKQTGRVEYTVNNLGGVRCAVLSSDIVWHIRMAPLTIDGLQGRPIYQTSREVFGRALAVKDYGNDWFRNSGQSGGFYKHPGNFKSKEEEEKIIERIRARRTGVFRHSDILLQYGMEYVPQVVQNDQAQFNETDKEAALAICRLWNVPPHRAGILDRATFSNIESQGLDFVTYTIAPYLCAIEQAIQRDLLTETVDAEPLCIEFDVSALLRGDIKTRFAAYASGRQWGWLSVNDIRRLENQKPIEDGDRYLEPVNMTQAGAAAAGEKLPAQADGPEEPAE